MIDKQTLGAISLAIELLATWPTARKSWLKPQEESPLAYNLALVALIMGRRHALDGRMNWS